ncbi:calcium-binding protein, partial [Pseudomonas citronellolis]|uniref:calcium-binding protein n=1 Tax=Pseudomonas citronellolis TaxID=53408 RepID=UPI000A5B7C9F
LLRGELGSDTITAAGGNDTLWGGAGNDNLNGEAGNDLLQGDEGNDYLYGGSGNDTLIGGVGNDYLSGDAGSDVYRFERGWGSDTVYNYDTSTGKVDAIEFGADIAAGDIVQSRNNDDLILSLKGTTDRIVVSNYFNTDAAGSYRVEEVRFADGTTWSIDQVKAEALQGTDGNDRLYGYATADLLRGELGSDTITAAGGNDTLWGGAGNDNLNGEAGNDLLQGDEGNDYLYGGSGNDTLIGGIGNDYLSGDAGSDTYIFNAGFGLDVVNNYHTDANTLDQLVFGDGVGSDSLWFRKNGSNLDVSVIGSQDKVSINNWYSGDAYHVGQFVSADGKTLMESQVQNLVNAMAAFGVPTGGESNLTYEQRQQLEVVIAANWK